MSDRSFPKTTRGAWSRRRFLQTTAGALAITPLLSAAGCESDDETPAKTEPKISPVGAGAKVAHGPTAGGVTDRAVRLAVRLDGPAKVQFRLTAAGKTWTSKPTLTKAEEDFCCVLDVSGLPAATDFAVETLVDDVAEQEGAITTRTFPAAGKPASFDFCFGSCCRYNEGFDGTNTSNNGAMFQVAASWPDKPAFFAQIGDWTYPDYAFADSGVDEQGNNHTVYPEELKKAWRRRFTKQYPLRNLLQKVPLAHVWDDHDFAENNAWKGVSGSQAVRIAAFSRYLPHYPLTPLVGTDPTRAGAWQKFTCGHCEFFLVDMRSQRTQVEPAFQEFEDAGLTKYKLVEPAGHTMLGPDQLQWLVDGLKSSKAMWKFVFFPIEVNPRYDALLQRAMDEGIKLIVTALGDSWVGYPTERKQFMDLHTSGQVKNLVFMTGDAHMAAMKGREPESPPCFMSANLDIGQAPIMDLIETFGVDKKTIWPEWSQGSEGEGSIGRIRVVTSPKHQIVMECWGPAGDILHSMTIDADV